ncbi:OTU domain-containing protein, partial [Parabacteroides goldsteinii]
LRRLDMPAASDPERKMIPEAQYVAEKNWIIEDYGGGGDCLFRALSASSDPEVFLKLRQEIVIEEQEAGLVQKGFVDANLMGMLENSLYPELRDLSVEAIHKQNIPIEAYHKLMALQGTWGGDMEILAFTRLGHQIVYVIDENGTMFCYEEGESQRIDEIPDEVWENESIVLYKTRDHWRRVTGRYHTQ